MLFSYLDNLNVALWRKKKDGTFIFINDKMAKLANKQHHQIIGYRDSDLFGVFAQRFQDGDGKVINNNRPFSDPAEPFPMPDGTVRFNYVHKVPIYDIDSKVMGTQGFYVDMSTYSKELPDAELLGALASHASILTHEVQNQLNTISVCAQLVLEYAEQGKEAPLTLRADDMVHYCNAIREISGSLKGRLNDLSRLRRQIKKEEHLNFVKLVGNELKHLHAAIHPHRAKFTFEEKSIIISGDAVHLRDAVRNLIVNAKEGIVRYLETNECDPVNFAVNVAVDGVAGVARLIVENTGQIPDEDLLILQSGLSKTRKPDKYAHGLGLPCVRECARLHNGKFLIAKCSSHNDCIIASMEIPLADINTQI